MTTRGQVKLNGEYDVVQTTDPDSDDGAPSYSTGERWLNTTTGDSFVLTDQDTGEWKQIETSLDAKIDVALATTYNRVIRECFSALAVQRQQALETAPDSISRTAAWYLAVYVGLYAAWTVSGAAISVSEAADITGTLGNFEDGDTVYIYGSRRNDGVHTITTVDTLGLTLSAALSSGDDRFVVLLIEMPTDLDVIIGRMIWYDTVLRNERLGLQSERIGSYSYQLGEMHDVGGVGYPADVVAGIDAYLSAGPIADAERVE